MEAEGSLKHQCLSRNQYSIKNSEGYHMYTPAIIALKFIFSQSCTYTGKSAALLREKHTRPIHLKVQSVSVTAITSMIFTFWASEGRT